MNSILSLSNDYNHLKYTDRKIFVIDKVFNLDDNHIFKKVELINNDIKDKEHLINGYKRCDTIYKNILKDLSEELNRIHKIKKEKTSWEIIIGKWLLEFVYICHKNFLLCEKALNEKNFNSIIMADPNSYSLHVNDTDDFPWATQDSAWNLCLNSKIIEFLKTDKKKEYVKTKHNRFLRKKNYRHTNYLKKKFLIF